MTEDQIKEIAAEKCSRGAVSRRYRQLYRAIRILEARGFVVVPVEPPEATLTSLKQSFHTDPTNFAGHYRAVIPRGTP